MGPFMMALQIRPDIGDIILDAFVIVCVLAGFIVLIVGFWATLFRLACWLMGCSVRREK